MLIIIEVQIIQIKLGNLLSDLGRQEEALFDYNKAIEINPRYANYYNNRGDNIQIKLGILLSDLGRKEEALIDYNKAIEINPKYVNAYNKRG